MRLPFEGQSVSVIELVLRGDGIIRAFFVSRGMNADLVDKDEVFGVCKSRNDAGDS